MGSQRQEKEFAAKQHQPHRTFHSKHSILVTSHYHCIGWGLTHYFTFQAVHHSELLVEVSALWVEVILLGKIWAVEVGVPLAELSRSWCTYGK